LRATKADPRRMPTVQLYVQAVNRLAFEISVEFTGSLINKSDNTENIVT
jgi:hypothetical protein